VLSDLILASSLPRVIIPSPKLDVADCPSTGPSRLAGILLA
jgi:hypothetical protein